MVGYLPVSSLHQKELRQLDGSTLDSWEGLHRPDLEQLIGYVRGGRHSNLSLDGPVGPQPRGFA